MSAACGHKWMAPRVPTPGIPPNHVEVKTFGVIVNATRVEQECVLRAGHDGPHRSLTGVCSQ